MENPLVGVSLIVNGQPISARVPERQTLLDFLRSNLGLTGTKNGCAQGHCGTCTVIVDGEAKRSCLLKASQLEGKRVETIEGLSSDGTLHPVQQAFVDAGAVACGFCTPGMIMAAKALLDRNPSPSVADIKAALRNNYCRCTGYVKIVQAVQRAAALLRGDAAALPAVDGGIGVSMPRVGAAERATGKTKFAADHAFEGMLYGKTLRAKYPHAEIVSVDISKAENLPGVVAVLTACDVPGENRFGKLFRDQPVLCDKKVRYVGDAVAAVFAESDDIAEQAVDLIDVQWKELPGVFSPQQALEPNAPLVHEKGNIHFTVKFDKGDAAKGFAEADAVVEQTYYMPFIDHAFMEPEAAVANLGKDDVLTVWTASQEPFLWRDLIADNLRLPKDKVRVVLTPSGGAFGGRGDITLQILCALGALHTKRPVKMVFTREESQRVRCKRHAEYVRCKTGATKDGRLTAMELYALADTGAYASVGLIVISRSTSFGTGPYKIPNVKVEGHAVFTNNPIAGAMRGFGSTQAAFFAESQMDALARKLNMDPLEFRLKNALEPGDTTAFGQTLRHSVGVTPTLRAARDTFRKLELPKPSGPGKKIGVGVATAWKNIGYGYDVEDGATAALELTREGNVLVRIGSVEMGQGTDTAMVQIATEALGIRASDIVLQTPDTFASVDGDATTASRQTYVSGNAVLEASKQLREQLLSLVAGELKLNPGKITLKGGRFLDITSGKPVATLADVAAFAYARDLRPTAVHYYSVGPTAHLPKYVDAMTAAEQEKFRLHITFCYASQIAVVEVDESTGEVRVLRVVAAHDSGKALNPAAIESQIEGGVVMGMGYALSEEFKVDHGQILTKTLRQCRIPDIAQMPEVVPIIVEDEEPSGPFGAKGLGEMGMNPTAPAIINAIYDAVGVRITDLPATREKVLAALQRKRVGT